MTFIESLAFDVGDILPPIDIDVRPSQPAATRVAPSAPAPLILVAEDNPINQMLVTTLIDLAGHAFELVPNGAEAVRAASERRYDLILMDVRMPELCGLAATRAIRQSQGPCADAPIIAMTANVCEADRDDCMAAGMTDILLKPLDRRIFLRRIAEHLPAQRLPLQTRSH